MNDYNNNFIKYLQNSNVRNYKKYILRGNINENNHINNRFTNTTNLYKCKICKYTFPNKFIHTLTMMDKCPSIDRSKTSKKYICMKTHLIIEYKDTIIKEDDLTTRYDIEPYQLSYFITNYLLVKCPICLNVKENCVIQKCGHCICQDCLCGILLTSNDKCWLCRQQQQYLFI